MFDILRLQGYYNVYAGVVFPNEKSEAFHLASGFDFVCDFKKIGYKFGNWLDLRWFQLYLSPHKDHPAPIRKIKTIENSAELIRIMNEANEKIQLLPDTPF